MEVAAIAEIAEYPALNQGLDGLTSLERVLQQVIGWANGEIGDDESAAFPFRPRYSGGENTIDLVRSLAGTTVSALSEADLVHLKLNDTTGALSQLPWELTRDLGVGEFAAIGQYATIGEYLTTGQYADIGEYLNVAQYATIGETIDVGTDGLIGNDLEIVRDVLIGRDLLVDGDAIVGGTLAAGATTLDSLIVTGAASVGTTLDVTGAATFAAAVTLGNEATDLTTVAGILRIVSATPLTGTTNSRLELNGGRAYFSAATEELSIGLRYSNGSGQYFLGAENSATPDLVFTRTDGTTRTARLTHEGVLIVGPDTAAPVGAGVGDLVLTNGTDSRLISVSAGTFQISSDGGGSPNTFEIDAAGLVTIYQGLYVVTDLVVDGDLGFYGAAPAAQPSIDGAATDPATTMSLVNSIRDALIDLNLAT
jgi:hypothetical protein